MGLKSKEFTLTVFLVSKRCVSSFKERSPHAQRERHTAVDLSARIKDSCNLQEQAAKDRSKYVWRSSRLELEMCTQLHLQNG